MKLWAVEVVVIVEADSEDDAYEKAYDADIERVSHVNPFKIDRIDDEE